jgi:hypothetical protein
MSSVTELVLASCHRWGTWTRRGRSCRRRPCARAWQRNDEADLAVVSMHPECRQPNVEHRKLPTRPFDCTPRRQRMLIAPLNRRLQRPPELRERTLAPILSYSLSKSDHCSVKWSFSGEVQPWCRHFLQLRPPPPADSRLNNRPSQDRRLGLDSGHTISLF